MALPGSLGSPHTKKRNRRRTMRRKEAAEARADMSDGDCSI